MMMMMIMTTTIIITRNSSGDEIAKRDFLHILAFPGYVPGSIAVNVTWMERGFNASQKHSSKYDLSSTVDEL